MNRVLQVIGGMNRAGAETFLMNVYRQIDKRQLQFDFLVYSPEKQDYEEEIVSLGGRVLHMPCHSGFSMLKSVKKIRNIIRSFGPYTAVHIHTLHNSVYSLLASKSFPRVKRIVHSHNTSNTVHTNFVKRAYERWSLKMIRKYAQCKLACGEEAGKYLFGEKFIDDGMVIHNGVEIEKFFNASPIEKEELLAFNICPDTIVIGSIARLSVVKNHYFMLDIAKTLRDWNIDFKMLLIGKGELEEPIRRIVQDNHLEENVFLLGTREDIPSLLKTMDVLLMPSLFEGNPVTLVEAQASGLPCVLSDAITNKMDMGLGLFQQLPLSGDVKDWARALIAAKGTRCDSLPHIRAALHRKQYDVQSTVTSLLQCYNEGSYAQKEE